MKRNVTVLLVAAVIALFAVPSIALAVVQRDAQESYAPANAQHVQAAEATAKNANYASDTITEAVLPQAATGDAALTSVAYCTGYADANGDGACDYCLGNQSDCPRYFQGDRSNCLSGACFADADGDGVCDNNRNHASGTYSGHSGNSNNGVGCGHNGGGHSGGGHGSGHR